MKKLTIKLDDHQALGLSKLIDGVTLTEDMTTAELSAFSLLKQWNSLKLKPKTDFVTNGMKFSVGAPLAFAFLALIEDVQLPHTTHLGNMLLTMSRQIDQAFK